MTASAVMSISSQYGTPQSRSLKDHNGNFLQVRLRESITSKL